jgi:hypothetical protein
MWNERSKSSEKLNVQIEDVDFDDHFFAILE